MMPLGRSPGSPGADFEGSDLTPDDLASLAPYDEWVVGLVEPDKTLRLYFADERLAKVVLHVYRGPLK